MWTRNREGAWMNAPEAPSKLGNYRGDFLRRLNRRVRIPPGDA
jgi:hypothetical protein